MPDSTMDGRTSIASALKQLYPDQEGLYYGAIIPYQLGGPDPLDGVEVYQSKQPFPHWHYVTYGFSELYEPDTDCATEVSGYGFELTFRLKCCAEQQPPAWPVNLLQNLARYVFSSGNVFAAGHHMNANGPIASEEDTRLTAITFLTDPELGGLDTLNGHMDFLQVVGITDDELQALMCWQSQGFLQELMARLPLAITDLSRPSLMDDPAFKRVWKEGVAREGSSTGAFYTDCLLWKQTEHGWQFTMGAGHTKVFATMLSARIGKKRSLVLIGPEQAITFQPGDSPSFTAQAEHLTLCLNDGALADLTAQLLPRAGIYTCSMLPLTLEITPTIIRDQFDHETQRIE